VFEIECGKGFWGWRSCIIGLRLVAFAGVVVVVGPLTDRWYVRRWISYY